MVVGILVVLTGMTVGGYLAIARGFGLQGMRSRLASIVRRARNTTLYEGAPASVHVRTGQVAELRDPIEVIEGEVVRQKRDAVVFDAWDRPKPVEIPRHRIIRIARTTRVVGVGYATVGSWRFEGDAPTLGYLGRDCVLRGGEHVYGKVGGAVELNPEGSGGKDRIVVRKPPADAFDPFRLPEGGRIEMWVYVLHTGRESWLVKRAGSYGLQLGMDGVLEGGPAGSTARTEDYVLPDGRKQSYGVPLARWVKLALMFSPRYVQISADDVPRGEASAEPIDPPEDAELIFGDGFSGVLDEVRVQRRIESDALVIPENFQYRGPTDIYFDARGHLDARYHTGAVKLEIHYENRALEVNISPGGMID